MNGADDTLIEKYGRHIPPILGKQLVLNLINEYLDDRLPINENSSLECVPSLERFHGSMLFVDISGFTVLSQRLNVDELRIHINGYFKKILDLVFKFRGEVIKFAGDALFIVWQTKVTIDDGDAFLMSQREAVAAATACGMEINQTCSNYKISFFQQDLHSSSITSALLVSREDMPTEIQENTKKAAESENFTFLNVHAGVSVGTMAGIDVGANDRWEYLLVGEPLVSVAKAEGEAAVAELVLCPDAHAILHPFDADFMTSGYELYLNNWQKALDKSEPIPLLPCGCQLTKGKFFKINQTVAGGSNVNCEDAPDPDYELTFYAELIQNVVKAYDDIKPRIYERYDNIVKPNGNDSAELPSIADEPAVGVSSSTSSKVVPGLNKEDKLFMHYLRWIQSCVIDDLVRHVHEADRGMITLRGIARKGALLTLARDDLLLSSSGGTEGRGNSKSSLASGGSTPTSVSASSVSVRRRTSDADRVFVSKIRNISQTSSSATRRKMKEHHERTLQQDAALTAELRSVMVLFIKLDVSGSLELFIDPTRANLALLDPLVNPPTTLSPRVGRLCKEISIESFNFLKRTKAEMEADCKLLSKFQSCMKIMTKIFAERGGQMRQFIVDDKGTVCIGTFGLRGSVNNDNAAAAIETAQDIIDQLVGIGIPSGVGITSGKAYCGLVGSSQRHEYAVMGPSINLSARLMAKSGWGEILCSEDARNRDRTHTFESCGTIVAKGYEHPVPIFKPLVGRGVNLMSPARVRLADVSPRDSPGHPEDSKHTAASSSHKAIISKARASTIGRKEELLAAFAFLLPSIHSEHPDLLFQTSAEEQRITIAPLDYERPTKLCIVEGGNGIGKSNFIQTFTGHLRNIVRCDRSLNLLVFRNQSSSFNSSEPFCSWKGVLEQMFQSVPNLSSNAGITKRDRFNMGVDLLLESMSAEMVELKPLLSLISYITDLPQTKATNSLTEANRVSKTAVFLAALIQQYCVRMKSVVAIMMDDLQSMDSASWQLLKHVFSNNKGLLVLGSYRPSNTVSGSTPKSSPTAAASSYVTDMLSFFESSAESFLTVHLDVLDEPSTWLYCQHLMESHNVKGANHTMVSAMRSISGGNPLYLYEIIASFAEKFKLSGSECDLTRQMCSNAFNDMIKSFRSTRIEEVISYRFDQLDPSSQLLLKIASVVCANGARFTISLMNAVMQDSDDPDDHEGGGNSRIFDLMKNTSGRSDEESAKQPSRETFDIIATVKGLLKRSEFIRTVASGPSSRASRLSSGSGKNRRLSSISTKRAAIVEDADDDMVGFEAMDLTIEDEHEFYGSLEFEFKVNVEQISVYALMLNDQKESLHDRVASYLEKKDFDAKGFSAAPTPSELFEQGFHWEHAANWSAAMVCYYKSAMILEVMGAFEEKFVHLTAAYRMLNAMRRDTGIMEARMEVPASFQLLFSSADNNSNSTGTEGSTSALTPRSLAASAIVRAKESPTLTKELVAKLFYGDSELLETGLQITLKLAQAGFSLSYNYFAYSQLYEEALQIILLTWKINIFEDHLGNNDSDFKPQISPRGLEPLKVPSAAPHLKRSPSKMSKAVTRAKLTLTSPRNDEFGLTDPTICFPILTGISAMYRFKRLKDDENHSKEATVINLFVALAQTSPAYRMHLVVGYCYKRSICFDQDKIQESIHLTDIARHYYDHDLYSAEVARIYGNDRMPFTMAMNVQILAMLGQHFRAKNYMMHVCELFPRIYHLHSMGITILVLAPLLVQFGMPQQAYEMFQMYVDGVAARGAFSFFHESNPIFLVWLKLEVLFAEFRVTGDVNIFMSDIQSESELSVVASKYLGRAAEQRPVYYSALETFGCGLEMVCSKVCFLRAQMWAATKQRTDQEIYGNLSFALKYINFNIACCEKDSKMAFGYYCALLIKAAILVTITKGMEKKCLYEEEESKNIMLEAKENVLKCLEFGKRLGYTFVCLSAGVVMEQLGIDAEFGLQVQKEYAKMGTMNVSGAALSAAVVKADPSLANEKYFKIGEIRPEDNFNCLTRLFPSLAKFREEILPQDGREKR